ncbi:MAG: AraC family transcriptional regulator [Lachnospiraceae bacterium]
MELGFTKEQIILDEKFPFDIYSTDSLERLLPTLHSHDCWEINYVESGSGKYFVDNQVLDMEEGDVYLFNNLSKHMAVSEAGMSLLVIVFRPTLIWMSQDEYHQLLPFYEQNDYFASPQDRLNQNYLEVIDLLGRIQKEWNQRKIGYELMIRALLLSLLGMLYRYCSEKENVNGRMKEFQKRFEKIRGILTFLQKHYTEDITLEQISKETFLSKSYINTNFPKVMECTLFEYVDFLRVNQSCMLLKTSDYSITQIATLCGFNSSSYFNRVFKRLMGVSPKDYSKNN